MKAGLLTLDQLIDDKNNFLAYTVLRDKCHLPDVTQCQYLQLQHLLTTTFGPAAFSVSETPEMLNQLVKSFKLKKPTIIYIVDICYK